MISFREHLYTKDVDDPYWLCFSFRDMICETFKPHAVDFGRDLKDKKWIKDRENTYVTFFKSGHGEIYVILFSRGHVGFGIEKESGIDVMNLKSLGDVNNKFMFRPRAVGNALKIFNQFIYIIFHLVDRIKPVNIYFGGLAEELKKLYKVMVVNKQFLDLVNNKGYFYKGYKKIGNMVERVHVFEKGDSVENI